MSEQNKQEIYYAHVKGHVHHGTPHELVETAAYILELLEPAGLGRPMINNTASGAIKLHWGTRDIMIITVYETSTEFLYWVKKDPLREGTIHDADQLLALAKDYSENIIVTDLDNEWGKFNSAALALQQNIENITDTLGETA